MTCFTLFCIFSTIADDYLATEGARASAAMTLNERYSGFSTRRVGHLMTDVFLRLREQRTYNHTYFERLYIYFHLHLKILNLF